MTKARLTAQAQKKHITSIGIENFKAFGKPTVVEFKNLTLLSGLNSSGKSSLYQAMLLISQSQGCSYTDKHGNILPYLCLNGTLITLGAPEDILHDTANKKIKITYKFSDNTSIDYTFTLSSDSSDIGLSHEIQDVFFLSELAYHDSKGCYVEVKAGTEYWEVKAFNFLSFEDFDLYNCFIKASEPTTSTYGCTSTNKINPFSQRVHLKKVHSVDLRDGFIWRFAIDISEYKSIIDDSFKDKISFFNLKKVINETFNTDIKDLVFRPSQLYSTERSPFEYKSIIFIPPFRGTPKRLYNTSNSINPLQNYNRQKSKIINYRQDGNVLSGTLEEAFSYWIIDHFQLCKKIIVEDSLSALVTEIFLENENGKRVALNNVGFGVSQILPIVYKSLLAPQDTFMIIDEPEIHLHPHLQSKLADFFLDMARLGKRILIETHSEYLIDKMIYNTIKHEDASNIACMYWAIPDNGSTTFEKIQYDELGFISNQPDGFLSEKKRLVRELNALRMEKLEHE